MENIKSVYIKYTILFSFNFWSINERHLIVCTDKINLNKGILTSKFGYKDMWLWKRSPAFVSTEEDEKLWILSGLI